MSLLAISMLDAGVITESKQLKYGRIYLRSLPLSAMSNSKIQEKHSYLLKHNMSHCLNNEQDISF